MKRKHHYISIKNLSAFALVFFISLQSILAAGSGGLRGRVLDKLAKEPLTGANLVIKNTSMGAAADLNGKFYIQNIPAGNYELIISYVGYVKLNVAITITEDQILERDFLLEPGSIEGQTIVITAQAQGQLSAINEQLSSNKIVNIVSSDKMKELPDANLAESIGRLPGVSLGRTAGEADKVIIRGLSAKFNKVTIEGVPMASTDASDRSIDLSMLSDDLVKSVEVSKSLRADMDADALGGTVNLTLKSAEKGWHSSVQAQGGYNDLTKSMRNYKVVGSVSNRFFDDVFGIRIQGSAEQKLLPSQQFTGNYDGPTSFQTTLPDGSLSPIQLRRKTNNAVLTVDNLRRQRYSASLILDFESEFLDVIFLNVYNQKNDHDNRQTNTINFQATGLGGFTRQSYLSQYQTEERTHSLQAKFKFWGTQLDAALSYTKGNYRNPGQDFRMNEINTPNPFGPTDLIYGNPGDLITRMGQSNLNNTYVDYLDRTDRSLSDQNYDLKLDYKIPFQLSDDISGVLSLGGKYHELDRSNRATSINYNMQWGGSVGRQTAFLSWLIANIDPTMHGQNEQGIAAANFIDHNYSPPKFLNGRYQLDPWNLDLGFMGDIENKFYNGYTNDNGQWIPGAALNYWVAGDASYDNYYNVTEKLSAFYLMTELNVGADLTIVPGVRYEEDKSNYGAYIVFVNNSNQDGLAGRRPEYRVIDKKNPNLFPSVNIKYKATENIQIMAAYYRSATRANFDQISPRLDYPNSGSIQASSNGLLKPALATNFDLGVSLYSNTLGLFSANVFYKEIKDYVYNIPGYEPYQIFALNKLIPGAPSDILSRLPNLSYFDTTWLRQSANQSAIVGQYSGIPFNSPEMAFIRGLELSWQTHLWYLPGVLSGIVLDLNLTLINSSTNYPFFNTVPTDTVFANGRIKKINYGQQYATRPGTLVDQPKAIYNVIVGWDYMGFSSRVSFRYQQKTLTSIDSKYALADSYYDNVLLIDITASQSILENLKVYANFTNINSHIDDYYYSAPNGNLPTNGQTYGFNAVLGVSYRL